MKNKGCAKCFFLFSFSFFFCGEREGQIRCIMGNVEVAYWPTSQQSSAQPSSGHSASNFDVTFQLVCICCGDEDIQTLLLQPEGSKYRSV